MIGFDEFTLLSEDRWKDIDPYACYLTGVQGRDDHLKATSDQASMMSSTSTAHLGSRIDDANGFAKLENLSRQHVKIPIKKQEQEMGFQNINRSNPNGFMT